MVERKVHSLLYKLVIFQKFLNTRDLTFYSCSVHRRAHFPLRLYVFHFSPCEADSYPLYLIFCFLFVRLSKFVRHSRNEENT